MKEEQQFQENMDKIQQLQQEVANALNAAPSGQEVLKASEALGMSHPMQQLMMIFGDTSAHEIDRTTMARYFGQSLEGDVQNKMQQFLKYLDDLVKNPDYQDRAAYYQRVRNGVDILVKTPEFEKYVQVYSAFLQDESDDAVNARDRIDQISEELRALNV